MSNSPKLTPKTELPPAVRKLCERVHAVADGLPALVFLPSADHAWLYPVVVIRDDADAHAALVHAFLNGEKMEPPAEALRTQHDLRLEAIHAAADYLPTIAFLPAADRLHPINLVAETVPEKLQPCYRAIQQAQKTAIGTQPIPAC